MGNSNTKTTSLTENNPNEANGLSNDLTANQMSTSNGNFIPVEGRGKN